MNRLEQMRRDAAAIFAAGLRAADPAEAIRRHLQRAGAVLTIGQQQYDLTQARRVILLGAGKAGAEMGGAVEELLGDRLTEGLVAVKYGHTRPLQRTRLIECSHPVPDDAGVRAAAQIAELARSADAGDLVVVALSGGASALLPLPVDPITLEEKQQVTQLLLASGADIHEINAVRKHLSRVKGGQLASLAAPARVLALLLSDVIGDDLDVIGSGPTAPDRSTYGDAVRVLQSRGLWDRVPRSIQDRLSRGVEGREPETPKPGDPLFARVQNVVVGSNALAVETSAQEARRLGYTPLILSTTVSGEAREVAGMHAAVAREVQRYGRPVARPACLLSGGETTVTIRGAGKGGRNQEFALAVAQQIAGLSNIVAWSAGTDGTDGPTDAAGAVVDHETWSRAREAGLDGAEYLARNDSYHFFEALGDLVKTGPTGTNVMDLNLLLID